MRPIGQPLDGVDEVEPLRVLQQRNRIAAGVAAGKALPRLSLRPDGEGGGIITARMKGTAAVPGAPALLQSRAT